jgi:hypothetical protein
MLILFALIAVVVIGWVVIGPRILPRGTEVTPTTDQLDGDWIRAADPGVTLELADGTYELRGAPEFSGHGTAVLYQGELILSDDPGCPENVGRYEVNPEALDGGQRLLLTLIEDACGTGTRAAAVGGEWVVSGSQELPASGWIGPVRSRCSL